MIFGFWRWYDSQFEPLRLILFLLILIPWSVFATFAGSMEFPLRLIIGIPLSLFMLFVVLSRMYYLLKGGRV